MCVCARVLLRAHKCECNDEPWAAFVNGSSVAAALAAS